jgi:hypothetical protein
MDEKSQSDHQYSPFIYENVHFPEQYVQSTAQQNVRQGERFE